jgi:hypothetical protein
VLPSEKLEILSTNLGLIGLSLPGTFRKRRMWVFAGGVRVAWVAEVVLINR